MCGIAGKVAFDGAPVPERLLGAMAHTLRHRGPDGTGLWSEGPVGLASTRLSVIDLTDRGRQPMVSSDGRFRIVFNGEIYNFLDLRTELEGRGRRFASRTDTETILHLYAEIGPACVDRLRGMFAFAIWDAAERTLFLARDRLGKKPLYYHHSPHAFVFASEPKAILRDPAIHARANPVALDHVLTFGHVPSDASAFTGFCRLPPAHTLTLHDGAVSTRRYWRLSYEPKRTGSTAAAVEELTPLLERAVERRLVADVPVGALLSGGLDSSTVVALMRRRVSGPLPTFSIGFDVTGYNELPYARAVAAAFETEHHDLVVGPDQIDLLPRLAWYYDEPFADSSALPTFALSALARRLVTVALSGDGGDESFLGYERYLGMHLGRAVDWMPRAVRRAAARAAGTPPAGSLSRSARVRRIVADAALDPWARYVRWMVYFDAARRRDLYTPEFEALVGPADAEDRLRAVLASSPARDPVEAAAHSDIQQYLPDDLLVKMDLASMAHSLEVRSPLLDQDVVEFAARLPRAFKLRGLTSKYILRQAMAKVLPPAVLTRRKQGFGVPLERWMRHDWRDLVHDTLLSRRAAERGVFRPASVRRVLDEHMSGRYSHGHRLWTLLMIESWYRTFIDEQPGA